MSTARPADTSCMFERFRAGFEIDGEIGCSGQDLVALIDPIPDGVADLMIRWSGASVGGGLYRLHPVSAMPAMSALAVSVFPEVAERALCFGVDWLGRQYAVDVAREAPNGQPFLLILDPWSAAPFEIDSVFIDFHDDDLVEYGDDILATELYAAWLDAGGSPPASGSCVGYRVPLYAGGHDHPANLEAVGLESAWIGAAAAHTAFVNE
jgi:hypothetical protein